MNPKYVSDSALEFTAEDCRQAIQAMPDNPKVPEYFHLMIACREEQNRRTRIRIIRDNFKHNRANLDPLKFPFRYRCQIIATYYDRDRLPAQQWENARKGDLK